MFNNQISSIKKNLRNIPGWRTHRHIVVIESDDWGSIRMSSLDNYEKLLKAGIRVDKNHYNTFDALECNKDLEDLMDVLLHFKDSTGRPPVITGVNLMANPDFEKIKGCDYQKYIYEPFIETCKRYPDHDKVYEFWKKGILERLLVPVFHGREHLNVQRWLRLLHSSNQSVKLAFDCGVTGIPKGINEEALPRLQAALDLDTIEDLPYMKEVLSTGLSLFEMLYGYRTQYFVAPNGLFNNALEKTLSECGVSYIDTPKRQKEPFGEGRTKFHTHFLGDRNGFGQIYITRNCLFEPASSGYEFPANYDWMGMCLKDIDIAFRWHKPAIISSHRVNYIGYLHPENREKGLRHLSALLSEIIKRWPDVEFMTSVELGDLIATSKK